MIISGTTIRGGTVTDFAEGLYPFTTFIFTTANTVGRFGPNLSTLTSWYNSNSSYSGNSWISNTNYFNQTVPGYQLWTVPVTGTYTIEVAGARAGARASGNASIYPGFGQGAVIRSSNINLVKGDKLQIVVGQEGLSYSLNGSGGGGGGTFVVKYSANLAATANADVIMVAGGGGSIQKIDANAASYNTSTYWTANSNGVLGSITGNASSQQLGGSRQLGGTNGFGGAAGDYPGGGGGFLGNGAAGLYALSFGIAYRFGANGGAANYTNTSTLGGASVGGFGGGSGTHGFTGGGGGGGGYSGGAGGKQTNNWDMGGGGGSFCTNAGYTQVGYNRGPGYVIITKN